MLPLVIAGHKVSNLFFDNCEVQKYFYDPTAFCFSHNCDYVALFANFNQNKFQIFALGSKVNTMLFETKGHEQQSLFDYYKEIGITVGEIYRRILGFKPKKQELF